MDKDDKLNKEVAKTYADDMAKIISSGEGGIVKKIIHGEEEHEKEKIEISPESKRNRALMFSSFILLGITACILVFFVFFHKTISTVPVEKTFVPFIFNDKSIYLEVGDLKKDAITQSIRNEVASNNVKEGEIEGVYLSLNKKVVFFREFIALIKANIVLDPKEDNPRINDQFMMGVMGHNEGDTFDQNRKLKNGDLFILMKVRNLPDIFDIFRKWENKMFFDLHDLFGVDISPDTEYLLTKNFENGIVENKNARILYGNDGKIVIMYVFVNDNYVVITNTEQVVREVILRLSSSKIGK